MPGFLALALLAAAPFTMEQLLAYPFPEELVAASRGSSVAWTFNERGLRNIYAADGPEFKARRVTAYEEDDGQELTNLAFTDDGKAIVYVRGGDHGANWPAEGNLPPDPSSRVLEPKVQVWVVAAAGGAPKLIGEGDEPAVADGGSRVAFTRDKKIWIAPLDGSKPAELAFFAKGTSESPTWSPDGRTLAFVSNRDDHAFIGDHAGADPDVVEQHGRVAEPHAARAHRGHVLRDSGKQRERESQRDRGPLEQRRVQRPQPVDEQRHGQRREHRQQPALPGARRARRPARRAGEGVPQQHEHELRQEHAVQGQDHAGPSRSGRRLNSRRRRGRPPARARGAARAAAASAPRPPWPSARRASTTWVQWRPVAWAPGTRRNALVIGR